MDSKTKLAAAALDVAAAAPWPENRRAPTARIPWEIIERIRAELDVMPGVDWREFKRTQDEKKEQAAADAIAKRKGG